LYQRERKERRVKGGERKNKIVEGECRKCRG